MPDIEIIESRVDISNLTASRVAGAAIKALKPLQKYTPVEQAVGVAMLMVILTRRTDYRISDLLETAHNMLDHRGDTHTEMAGVGRYLEHEVLRKGK